MKGEDRRYFQTGFLDMCKEIFIVAPVILPLLRRFEVIPPHIHFYTVDTLTFQSSHLLIKCSKVSYILQVKHDNDLRIAACVDDRRQLGTAKNHNDC
ncbi:hypothetical protein D3C71_1199890 [compost metagenome]